MKYCCCCARCDCGLEPLSKLLSDGVKGEGEARLRESLELVRERCGVRGARLGVDAQLEDSRECAMSGGR